MTERYLIALDLDGTLLTDDKRITPFTQMTIQQLIEQGHVVVIATGRSQKMSILYYQALNLNTPLINSNGAIIHHPKDKNWGVYHFPLDIKTAQNIIEMSYSLNSKNILAVIHDDVIVDRFDEHVVNFYNQGSDDGLLTIGPVIEHLKENPTLMMVYPDKNHLETFTNQLNDLHAKAIDHRNWGEPFHVIEIMNKSMNKAVALNQVADYYQIPRERIIAFGDESNDLEMIDFAKIGVAMNNGIDELKSIAKYVTKSNEEDGVALFLADYFKIKIPVER